MKITKQEKLCSFIENSNDLKVRSTLDLRNEKLGRKIHDNELKRIPYMLIVGEKKAAEGLVSMRQQGGGEQATMKVEDFAVKINAEVREMTKGF